MEISDQLGQVDVGICNKRDVCANLNFDGRMQIRKAAYGIVDVGAELRPHDYATTVLPRSFPHR